MDHLKVKRSANGEYDWSVLSDVNIKKSTFIFPNNHLLRIDKQGDVLIFLYVHFKLNKGSDNDGNCGWDNAWVNLKNGRFSANFNDEEIKKVDRFMYTLLVFFYLSENEFKVVNGGAKHGTRKTGKIVNDLPIPVTIVNNNLNVTTIRTESF